MVPSGSDQREGYEGLGVYRSPLEGLRELRLALLQKRLAAELGQLPPPFYAIYARRLRYALAGALGLLGAAASGLVYLGWPALVPLALCLGWGLTLAGVRLAPLLAEAALGRRLAWIFRPTGDLLAEIARLERLVPVDLARGLLRPWRGVALPVAGLSSLAALSLAYLALQIAVAPIAFFLLSFLGATSLLPFPEPPEGTPAARVISRVGAWALVVWLLPIASLVPFWFGLPALMPLPLTLAFGLRLGRLLRSAREEEDRALCPQEQRRPCNSPDPPAKRRRPA
jgi:hypothetical protein